MATTCSIEVLKGYISTNPTTQRGQIVLNESDSYRLITVFNETDKPVLIDYKNQGNNAANFYVPANGRVFTRVINGGLLNNSLGITAIGGAATGTVFINLGN